MANLQDRLRKPTNPPDGNLYALCKEAADALDAIAQDRDNWKKAAEGYANSDEKRGNEIEFWKEQVTKMRRQRDAKDAEIERLRDVLELYADPSFYHACMVMADRPAGGFADDFSEDHGEPFYDRPMPGKAAREALDTYDKGQTREPRPGEIDAHFAAEHDKVRDDES